MGVKEMVLCLIFLLFHIASSTVTKPTSLQYNVGDTAPFMWNATKIITQVRFGLYDFSTKTFSQQFVSVNPLAGVQYSNLTNTAAERYAGRVEYVGDLTRGRAWFNLTNLMPEDFNKVYVARIREDGDVGETFYPVNLTIRAAVPTPTPSISTVPSSSPSTSSSSTTTEPSATPSRETPAPDRPKWWLYLLIAFLVIVVCCSCILIGCYCFCPKYLKDFCDRFCCCCPCCQYCSCCPCCPCCPSKKIKHEPEKLPMEE